MRTLLTGFEPFPGYPHNPSQWVVERLGAEPIPGVDLETQVLPVDYARAGKGIGRLIREIKPEAVLALGLAGKRRSVRLERVSLNLNDSTRPDNRGRVSEGQPIDPQAPAAYFSSLPLIEIREALAAAGIPVRISNLAGAYLCNHVFFSAMHTIEALGLASRAGFVHLPQAAEYHPDGEGLSLSDLKKGVEIVLSVLRKTRSERHETRENQEYSQKP